MKNKVLFLASMAILGATSLKAQLNVGSTSAADPSAILQATSTTKGFLPPVMTTTQRNAIVTPAPGLLIFNSTTNQQEVNSGTTSTPVWGANTAATFYNGDGTLATNRIVTQGANTLSYLGTGGIKFKSGSVNFDSSALIGKGDSLSGGVIGIGVTTNGGLNMGQYTIGNNIYIGYNSGKLNTTGFGNVFTGAYSGPGNTSGVGNTFHGYGTGQYNTTGSNNTFTGYGSGQSNTTGNYNTFSGQQSGQTNNTSSSNTFTGFQSGLSNTANNNTFTGYQSGSNNTTGSFHTFSGYQSGLNNTTGGYNTFSGYQSGLSNTTGYSNVFTGYQSGMSNTTGTQNIFYGTNSGRLNTQGYNNTFNGMNSGSSNTTGYNNVFTGINSGFSNTTASSNTFNGYQSGYYNTTGLNNVFTGVSSGQQTSTGNTNTFIGNFSGYYNTTGTDNTALGSNAGPSSSTPNLTNSTSIGANTQATQSNTIILGNNANVGIGTTTPSTALQVNGNVKSGLDNLGSVMLSQGNGSNAGHVSFFRPNGTTRIGYIGYDPTNLSYVVENGGVHQFNGNIQYNGTLTSNSDRRLKTNIIPLNSALAKVMQLAPYSYSKKASISATDYNVKEIGFMAQDIRKIFPDLVAEGNDKDKTLSVNYTALIPVLTKAIQEQQAQNDTQVAQIADLKKANLAITKQNNNILAQNAAITAQLSEMKDLKIAMAAMQSELTKIAAANKASTINIASN